MNIIKREIVFHYDGIKPVKLDVEEFDDIDLKQVLWMKTELTYVATKIKEALTKEENKD